MQINIIKPKHKGKSDKYSWQIYQYIIKNFKYTKDLNDIKVFFNNIDRFSDKEIVFNPADIKISQIIVGRKYSDDVVGGNLSTIMSPNKNKYQMGSYCEFGGWRNEQFEDITDWFWSQYIKLGRCLLDKEHRRWWTGEDSRFTHVNNTRRCNWCGQWQEKQINKVIKIQRDITWANQNQGARGEYCV